MKRTYRIWSWIWLLVVAVACQQEDIAEPPLSVDQQSLIGRAINFDASYAQPFATKTTYDNTGVFNEGDRMRIYRQYYKPEQHGFDEQTEAFRTYSYVSRVATGTSIVLGKSWKVEVGKQGSNGRENGVAVTFTQAEKDSLTWESGQTVRFRAWALSNLSGCINTSSWDGYYPDFSVSEWVTASGPTMQVPLTLKHIGCRLHFTRKGGNQIYKIEFATEKEDYEYEDNAGSSVEDENDKEKDAADCAQRVSMAYHQLCWPGGVSFDGGLLALPKMTETTSFFQPKQIDEYFGEMIPFGTRSADDIRDKAERPRFNNLNEDFYLIAIPYDMSTTGGQPITLPACTRFRIYLRDVNNGDDKNTSGYEGAYHLFCLKDIKDENGKCPFAEGLTLKGGCSYSFSVGYQYGKLTISTSTDLSWKDGGLREETSSKDDLAVAEPQKRFEWWKKGLDEAIAAATATDESKRKSYAPEFEISTAAQFREFIQLVNGTAATKTEGLTRAYRTKLNTDNNSHYWWYRTSGTTPGDTTWVTKQDAEKEGYLFYNQYYPSDGDRPAYYIEELLTAPYSFYDSYVMKKLKVKITAPIDFNDLPLPGMTQPFSGWFEGGMNTLKALYITHGILFGRLEQAVVTNLTVQSWHPLCLVGSGKETLLAGLALHAPSSGQLAQTLVGECTVVGCVTTGTNGHPLVGKADNLSMQGCLQACSKVSGAALLGGYDKQQTGWRESFKPLETAAWGSLMGCYYDRTTSPNIPFVGGESYSYKLPQQYVRALDTWYLCALEDHLLQDPDYYDLITSDSERRFYYGLAPWRALNSVIYHYNQTSQGKLYPCNAHFQVSDTGFDNRYPQLVSGAPTDYKDLTQQNN